MPLDPKARQRPDFIDGTPVKMADGQLWEIPKPRVRFGPADGDKGYRPVLRFDNGDTYQSLLDDATAAQIKNREYRDCIAQGIPVDLPEYNAVIKAEMRIMSALVLRNYDLTTEELGQILQVSWDDDEDEEGYELYDTLIGLAYGNAPKRKGDTSDSS